MAWTRTRLEVPAITGDPSVLLAAPPPDGGWTPRLDLLRVCPLCRPSNRRSVPLRAEQVPGLLDGKAGGLAVRGVELAAADRLEGVERCGVAGDQGVEEMPEGGQGLVLGGAVAGVSRSLYRDLCSS